MTRAIFDKYSLTLLFLLVGCLCIFHTREAPIKDFGNYYYGSKLLLDGKFNSEIYTSIHYFNKQIALYGEKNFFENYIPVPPFSALFYLEFSFLKSTQAKLVFNSISLLFFCISILRLRSYLKINQRIFLLLPFVFFFSIYSNILQGQAYLLICALLILAFLALEKKQVYLPSFILAIVISLKLFPVIILIYFLLKKEYKPLICTICFVVFLLLITYLILPVNTVLTYYTTILPRLLSNDVVGPYYPGNQSVYTFLLQLFSFDSISNTNPLLNNSLLIVALESLFTAIVLTIAFLLRNKNSYIFYSFTILCSIILSRYNTSYGMLLLLPMCISLINATLQNQLKLGLILLLFFYINLSFLSTVNFPFLLKFMRLWGLLLLLPTILIAFQLKINYKTLLLFIIPLFIFKYFSFPIKPISYFNEQNTKGILYGIELQQQTLVLKSTLGEKDFTERVELNGKIEQSDKLSIQGNVLYYQNKPICTTKDNKLNPFIYNDSTVVFMSDLNQGVAFYKLRMLSLKEKR